VDESPIIWSGGSKCKLPPDFVMFLVNYGGQKKQVSREFGVGNASANIVPHILSCFKISNARLLALQRSKKFSNP